MSGRTAVLGGWKRLVVGHNELRPAGAGKKARSAKFTIRNVGDRPAKENVLILVTATLVDREGQHATRTPSLSPEEKVNTLIKRSNGMVLQGKNKEAERCASQTQALAADDPMRLVVLTVARHLRAASASLKPIVRGGSYTIRETIRVPKVGFSR